MTVGKTRQGSHNVRSPGHVGKPEYKQMAVLAEHAAHAIPPTKTRKARRRSVARWLLAHLLAPPPTIRPRRKRVRQRGPVADGQQSNGQLILEEISKRSTSDPASLDFRALLEQSLVGTVASSDQNSNVVSENSLTRSLQDSGDTRISSSEEPRSGQQPIPADTRAPGKEHRQGYWGYWSWPKS